MPPSSTFHTEAHKAGETILDRSELRSFVAGLHYPLHFFDFETFGVPIPPIEGISPYTNVPFQYSLHIQHHLGGDVTHTGYLAQSGSDPREELLVQFLEETDGEGDIIVYNASFERNVLKGLAKQL